MRSFEFQFCPDGLGDLWQRVETLTGNHIMERADKWLAENRQNYEGGELRFVAILDEFDQ